APYAILPPTQGTAPVAARPAVAAAPGCPGGLPSQQASEAASRWDNFRDHLQDCVLGYLPEYDAPPLGATIGAHFRTQVRNADPDRLMLHDYDFMCGTDQLNYRGKEKLAKMAAMLAGGAPAVLIEVTPLDLKLSEARRLSVTNCLLAKGLP